jgi:hypothetical protein
MREFMSGAVVMGCFVASLFFLKFWRKTADRLFLFFFLAFSIMAINWTALAFIPAEHEARTIVYVMRLVSNLLILAAIIDKNRHSS